MSRNNRSLRDYDKRLKPVHLNGGPNLFTVTHVAEIPQPRREKIVLIGGDRDAFAVGQDENSLVLYFRESGTKAFTLNTTNRNFLAERVGDDPLALIGCVLTLERKPLAQRGFGASETIAITAVRKPGQAASKAEQQAVDALRKKALGELSTKRKQEKALLDQLGKQQDVWKNDEVMAWPAETIAEKTEQLDDSIAFLTERIQTRKLRQDIENRVTNMRMEAQALGDPPSIIDLDSMTEDEMQDEIERAANYIKAHAK